MQKARRHIPAELSYGYFIYAAVIVQLLIVIRM